MIITSWCEKHANSLSNFVYSDIFMTYKFGMQFNSNIDILAKPLNEHQN